MTSEVRAPESVDNAAEEAYFTASSWTLMRRNLVKHRLAILGGSVLALLYLTGAIAPGFFSTYDTLQRNNDYILAPLQRVRVVHEGRPYRPFVYGLETTRDPETFRRIYVADKDAVYPIRFLVRGADYKLFGFVTTNIRLLGVAEPGVLFLFGTDELGRDMYSRTLHGARISLTIGLVGVAISFILGCLLGGISGYFGGAADMFIQRVIEFFSSIPTLRCGGWRWRPPCRPHGRRYASTS